MDRRQQECCSGTAKSQKIYENIFSVFYDEH